MRLRISLRPAVFLGFVASVATGCSYDFDAAFEKDPLYGPHGDGGSTDAASVDVRNDTKQDGPQDSESGACSPDCSGKCPGADDGCGATCEDDDCAGTCCGTSCCTAAQECTDTGCCTPATCAGLGIECGPADDGCGGSLSCGTCSAGPCDDGTCTGCPYLACSGQCCGEGQVCSAAGECCTPFTCAQLGVGCGQHDDGCGNSLVCGTCVGNEYCLNGQNCSLLGMTMQTVSAGTFTMGSPTTEPGRDEYADLNEVEHEVTLTRAFEIANIEVTQADFVSVMGYQPSYFTECGDSCPVEYVTWDEAANFCNTLSDLKQLPRCFDCSGSGSSVSCAPASVFTSPYECPGFRLPTEAEWERAARASTQTAFYSGNLQLADCSDLDPHLGQIGRYIANSAVAYSGWVGVQCDSTTVHIGMQPVGSRAPNAFGLYDMAGNAWEWVMECGADYSSGAQVDPVGSMSCNNRYRVYRGGGAGNTAAYCRHAERANYTPSEGRNIDIGFRPARTTP